MGRRTRDLPWHLTSLGSLEEWPQSLRTAISIVLHSKFPMFLFWGPELLCFYNDAYRPSLGSDGKHPYALGKPASEIWPETWQAIKPIIDSVLAGGEANWSEDLLLPIYRNGSLEDVYWTFSYSAVYDETDKPAGVFVTCIETTEKVKKAKTSRDSENYFRQLTDTVPAIIWITQPDGRCTYLNKNWYNYTGQSPEEAEGFGWLDATHPDDKERTGDLFRQANDTRTNFSALYRLRTINGEYRWAIDSGTPKFSADGTYEGMIGTVVDVHEQKTTEDKIKESEGRFRSLINAAPVAIGLFVGRDLIIEEPNQTFIDIVGKGASIIGGPLREAMPELITEGQPFLKILDDVYTKGETFQTFGTQVKIVQNGVLTYNYYDFTYTPLFNKNGEVYAILDIAIDVTTQVMATKALEESEQNLRNMVLQAPVAICILRGENHTVQIANERIYELWGRSGHNFSGMPIFEALPEVRGQGLEQVLDTVFATGEPFRAYEAPVILPRNGDVETVYLNFVYEAFRETDGTISGIIAVVHEVTEQVLARQKIEENEQQLQLSNDRLQLAIDAGELGLFELNMVDNSMETTPRFNEIFNIGSQNVREDYVSSLHPDDLPVRERAYFRANETGVLDYTARIIYKNSLIHWARIKGIMSFDENRRPLRLLGIVQDVTEQKELEYQKDSFLGIASHELKTPVTSIKAYAQVMEALFKRSGEEKYADMMSRIDKQVNRLNYLIADLLDVTKINSGRLEFNITRFDFNEMVEELTDDLQRISPNHAIRKDLRFRGFILSDRDRIIQVITNLVNNAIKYSPNASAINILTDQKDGEVTLCVEDYGIGIGRDKTEKVFEQFYRVSGTKEHTFPGLGLGLYISSEIIKRMGGRIWVNSVEGRGSKFCFSFPIKH